EVGAGRLAVDLVEQPDEVVARVAGAGGDGGDVEGLGPFAVHGVPGQPQAAQHSRVQGGRHGTHEPDAGTPKAPEAVGLRGLHTTMAPHRGRKRAVRDRDRRRQPIGRAVGGIGYGRSLRPVRWASTPRAAARPSAMAHTIRDWPRPMSPAANTPSTDVRYSASRTTLPRWSRSTPSWSRRPSRCGTRKPIARVTSSAGISRSVPSTGSNPVSGPRTSTIRRPRTLPSASPTNSVVDTA